MRGGGNQRPHPLVMFSMQILKNLHSTKSFNPAIASSPRNVAVVYWISRPAISSAPANTPQILCNMQISQKVSVHLDWLCHRPVLAYASWLSKALATPSELAGFWPVIRRPSVTT